MKATLTWHYAGRTSDIHWGSPETCAACNSHIVRGEE